MQFIFFYGMLRIKISHMEVSMMQRKITGTPACPADLKYTNRMQVMDAFLNGGSYTASEIAASTGLSRQTVMKSIQFFLGSGLLTSDGKGDSTTLGGKRPELFSLSRRRYFLCVTLWPQELRLHLTTIGNQKIDSLCLAAALPEDPKDALDHVGSLSARLLEKNQIPLRDVCAVSLSTAGIMDYKTGNLKYSSQSPAWGADVPLTDLLRPYFAPGTLIFPENAGKMAARPFLLEPELSGKRVLVIFSCWGLSSCLIEKERILSGRNSLMGEIGHMVIDPDDPEACGCGSNGCLERLVSVERIRALARREAHNFTTSPLSHITGRFTLPEVFDASANGDSLARFLVDYLAHCFAIALRNISLVFDPDLIVFQGDYAFADEFFHYRLRKYIQEFQYFPAEGPFDIRYDRRSLTEMDTLGSFIALTQRYFDTPALYTESATEI